MRQAVQLCGILAVLALFSGPALADSASDALLTRQLPATLSHVLRIPVQVIDTPSMGQGQTITLNGLRLPVLTAASSMVMEAHASAGQLTSSKNDYHLNLALPASLTLYADDLGDMDGMRVGEASLAPSSLDLRWSKALAMPEALTLRAKNLLGRALPNDQPIDFALADLSVDMEQRLAGKVLHYKTTESLTGLSLQSVDFGQLGLARASFRQDVQFPLAGTNTAIKRLNEAVWGTMPFGSDGRLLPTALAGTLDRLHPLLTGLKADQPAPQGRWALAVAGLAVDILDFGSLSAQDAEATLALGGTSQNNTTLRLNGTAQGLKVAGFSPQAGSYMPREGKADISVSRLPLLTLMTLLSADPRSTARLLAGQARLPDTLRKALLEQMQAAGTTLNINSLVITAQDVALTATGALALTRQTRSGLLGSLDADIAGLDALLPKLATLTRGDPELVTLVPMLTLMQAMGQQVTMPDGRQGRRYRVEFTPSGQILLNGTDLSPLMGSLL